MADNSEELKIRVKTADGRGEIEVLTSTNETILDLKNKISQMMELSPEKYLRLIFGGKLLDPPESVVGSFKMLKSGSFVHAVISNRNPSAHVSSSAAHSGGAANFRGLDTLLIPNPATGRPGLTTADITTIRAVHRESIEQFTAVHMTRQEGESNDDFRYRCETEWMAAQDYHSEFQSNLRALAMFRPHVASASPNGPSINNSDSDNDEYRRAGSPYEIQEMGTTRDFFMGFCLGLAFGFMMIFCIWDRNITQKQKVGILCGILAQGFMGSYQQKNQHEGSTGGRLRGAHGGGNGGSLGHGSVSGSGSSVNSGGIAVAPAAAAVTAGPMVDVHANDVSVGMAAVAAAAHRYLFKNS